MLLGLKNQKYPVSPVTLAATPVPDVPWGGTLHATETLNRPFWRHRVLGLAVQVPAAPVAIRPTRSPEDSVNHMAPSGPATMPSGRELAVGTSNSGFTRLPDVAIRP